MPLAELLALGRGELLQVQPLTSSVLLVIPRFDEDAEGEATSDFIRAQTQHHPV